MFFFFISQCNLCYLLLLYSEKRHTQKSNHNTVLIPEKTCHLKIGIAIAVLYLIIIVSGGFTCPFPKLNRTLK